MNKSRKHERLFIRVSFVLLQFVFIIWSPLSLSISHSLLSQFVCWWRNYFHSVFFFCSILRCIRLFCFSCLLCRQGLGHCVLTLLHDFCWFFSFPFIRWYLLFVCHCKNFALMITKATRYITKLKIVSLSNFYYRIMTRKIMVVPYSGLLDCIAKQ